MGSLVVGGGILTGRALATAQLAEKAIRSREGLVAISSVAAGLECNFFKLGAEIENNTGINLGICGANIDTDVPPMARPANDDNPIGTRYPGGPSSCRWVPGAEKTFSSAAAGNRRCVYERTHLGGRYGFFDTSRNFSCPLIAIDTLLNFGEGIGFE